MLHKWDFKVMMSKFAFEKNACPYADAIVLFSKLQHYELVIVYVIHDAYKCAYFAFHEGGIIMYTLICMVYIKLPT